MKICCDYWNPFNEKEKCLNCGGINENVKKITIPKKVSGLSPSFIVVDEEIEADVPKLKYWCVMEMRTIDGETRTETYDDIGLEDFEIIYGGIVDLITSVELRQMPEQVIEIKGVSEIK